MCRKPPENLLNYNAILIKWFWKGCEILQFYLEGVWGSTVLTNFHRMSCLLVGESAKRNQLLGSCGSTAGYLTNSLLLSSHSEHPDFTGTAGYSAQGMRHAQAKPLLGTESPLVDAGLRMSRWCNCGQGVLRGEVSWTSCDEKVVSPPHRAPALVSALEGWATGGWGSHLETKRWQGGRGHTEDSSIVRAGKEPKSGVSEQWPTGQIQPAVLRLLLCKRGKDEVFQQRHMALEA